MALDIPGYRILTTLSSTPKTRVCKAIRLADNKTVIVKREEVPKVFDSQSRFRLNYELLQRFDSPLIIKALDWLESEHYQTLIMEDFAAVNLANFLQQTDQALPLPLALQIAKQLAEAVVLIHQQQIVHRDIHPGNVLINPDTLQLKVTDFELASLLSRERSTPAPPERLEGSLAYLSPEQTGRVNRSIDHRSDLYSLGIVLFELFSGEPPFSAPDALGYVHAHIARPPPSLTAVRPEIPPALAEIIDKLLNKNPEDRYQSAYGLLQDVTLVESALSQPEKLAGFTSGRHDRSEQFRIPEKLYGRDQELQSLLDRYTLALQGQPQLVQVSGPAGAGKSTLIRELQGKVAHHQGLFLTGKYDARGKQAPYAALKVAFREWIQFVLSLPEAQLIDKRTRLNRALGHLAPVLLEFMPEFTPVLGNHPSPPLIGAAESQARFQTALQGLLKFITEQRPLVLFLDDVQWSDAGTLSILPSLMDCDAGRLLIILAYRDTELAQSPLLSLTLSQLDTIVSSAGQATNISLAPLSRAQVSTLLSDTLYCNTEDAHELAEIVQTKTAGNPLFVAEFLQRLYRQEIINFNQQTQRWHWDRDAVQRADITENVLELLIKRIQELPKDTIALLPLAACFGGQFNTDDLARLCDNTPAAINRSLWPALVEGLLVVTSPDTERVGTTAHPQQLAFAHDRMTQVAYQLLNADERIDAHFRIGQLLSERQPLESTEQVFTLVAHLNIAIDRCKTPSQCSDLASWNLQAAELALGLSAWQDALEYARIAEQLIGTPDWPENSELGIRLYRTLATAEYLTGHADEAQHCYSLLLQNTQDDIDKAGLYIEQMTHAIGWGHWQQAMDHAQQALLRLEQPFHNDPTWLAAQLPKVQSAFQQQINRQGSTLFRQLPALSNRAADLALRAYTNLSQASIITGNPVLATYSLFKGLCVTVSEGRSALTVNLMANYAMYLTRLEQLDDAKAIAQEALALIAEYPHGQEIANSYNILAGMVLHLSIPYPSVMALHQKGYQLGMERGELARAAMNLCNILYAQNTQGYPLSSLLDASRQVQALINRHKVFHPIVSITELYAQALSEPDRNSQHALNDEYFEPEVLSKINVSIHLGYLVHYRSLLAFWHDDLTTALDLARQAETLWQQVPPACFKTDHVFLLCLLTLRTQSLDNALSDADYQRCQARLQKYHTHNSANFAHLFYLIEAERALHESKPDASIQAPESLLRAARLYDQSIEAAKQHGFLHIQALANERCGEWWLSQGFSHIAGIYLLEACRLYEIWQCKPRVYLLQKRYRELLLLANNTQASSREDSTPVSESLDLASMMKSAQTLSSELNQTRLIEKVMRVICENAGATASALILLEGNQCIIAAEVQHADLVRVHAQRLTLEQVTGLPSTVIHYVIHTQEALHVRDVKEHQHFRDDPALIEKQSASILCIPIRHRDQTLGVLYLENTLSTDVFTPQRMDALQLLLAQAAISYENARLFSEINQLNASLERKVAQRTRDLEQANQRLNSVVDDLQHANNELSAFSYSVSHDLRSPLRSLRGFSQILLDDFQTSLPEDAVDLIKRIIRSGKKMTDLIDGLLELSRVQRRELVLTPVDLSGLVSELFNDMRERYPHQQVETQCQPGLTVMADERLLFAMLENLIGNAWKYSASRKPAHISFGVDTLQQQEQTIYYLRDDGVGFNMLHADKLFTSFQRLHSEKQFPGTGIGLATVKRIVEKHGGRIWADARPNQGATFYFTLGGT